MKLNDTLLAEPHQMGLYDELINNRKAKLIPGGAAQNTARGAQYMLPPDSVWYIGCVGDDEYAQILREKCNEQGLRVEYRVDKEVPTGKCGVVITDKHRTMLTHLAAANEYKIEHLQQPEIWSMAEKSLVYYVGGYHLTVCVPAAMALAEHAAKENKIYMLSLSAGFVPQFFKDQLAQVLPYCDYVFGNENEAQTWAESQDHKGISIADATKLLAQTPKVNDARPRIVITTQGTDPTLVAISKGNGEEVELKSFPVATISEDEINDTNGAGDAFAGGFSAGVVQGKSLEECIEMGQWLARLSLKELGPS